MLPANDRIVPFRFSTSDVPPQDRVAVWREVLGRVHLRLDLEPLGEAPVHATVETHSWSCVSLYFSETTPVSAARTPELLSDGNGDFRLLRVEGARYQCISNGAIHDMDESGAILLSSGTPAAIRYLGPCRVTSLRIRRESLSAAIRGIEDQPVWRLSWNACTLSLISGFIEQLRKEGPAKDPAFAHKIAHFLIDLTALALNPAMDRQVQSAGAVREARLAAVRADILAHLSQVSLSAKTVARRHGISDRYIHLIFEETGETFGGFVLEERLKRAFQLLSGPLCANVRISDIAFSAGFGDLSTFNRAFRRRFGMTPSDVRAAAWRSSRTSGS
jgi:AraC-like DNA-binding protein